jgi:hypothetical protein
MAGVSKLAALRFIALLAALSFLTACGEQHSWHQKTILEIETPNGIVVGSSVVEASVRWFEGIEKLSSNAAANGVRGEASFVEVAPGRYLFALLDGEEAAHAIAIFSDLPNEDARVVTKRLQTLKETRAVPQDKYPRLVTFTDVSDPKSVKLVDPANLAAVFGPEVALKSMTRGAVEELLAWWCPYHKENRRLSGDNGIAIKDNELANNLAAGSFRVGECTK